MKKLLRQTGVTLVELMIVVAVIGILGTLAAPAFFNFIADNTLTTATNNFVAALTYARSEAVRRGNDVTMIATNPVGDNEWGGGWTVQQTEDDGSITVIRVFDPVPGSAQIDAQNGETSITFDSRGLRSTTTVSTFNICDSRPDEIGRQITLSPLGRPDLNRNLACTN